MSEQATRRWSLYGGRISPAPIPGTLNDFFDAAVARHWTRIAATDGERRLSYAEVARQRSRLATCLVTELGVAAGDRVALVLPNCAEYVSACFAVLRVGGVVVQVNPMYTGRELTHILVDSGAVAAVVHASAYDRVRAVRAETALRMVIVAGEPVAAMEPGDVRFEQAITFRADRESAAGAESVGWKPVGGPSDLAALQYTGGTTGVSKGAMLTHANLLGGIEQTSRLIMPEGAAPRAGSAAVAVAPLFHIFGFTMVLLLGLRHGWNLLCVPRFEPAAMLDLVRRERPAVFAGVAPIFAALAGHPHAAGSGLEGVALYISGGAPVPEALAATFRTRFGRDIWEGYGMSEGAPLTFNTYLRGPRPGTVGVPIPGTDVRTVDLDTARVDVPAGEPGELLVRGPQVMQGYWNMPQETELVLRDGWLRTGDVAVIDDDGFVSIVDRRKDMINVAGFKVYPREVEEVLYMHPAVLEAVVIGIPDEHRGETVKAFVVAKAGQKLTAEELIAHCRRQLAGYKVPDHFEFREQLPKSAVGKLLRRLLAEEHAAARQTGVAVPRTVASPGRR